MKPPNSVSQKIWILHKIHKKGYFEQKCQASEKYVHFHAQLGWASFCMNYCISAAWHGGDQPVALLRCNEAQVALIAAFRSSVLLSLVSLIFLLTIPHRISGVQVRQVFGQSSTVTPWSFTSFWYRWQCGQVPSPAGKWNQHHHKACQQKEAWSDLKFPGRWLRWLWTSENPVDQHQQMTWHPQIITDCGNFTLDFKQHGFCASPPFLQTLGPWFPNEC